MKIEKEATEVAISNPLLENNSMKGQGVLINVTRSDDTSLHDIDLAINRVQEESDDEANIIWGVQKDDNFEGKFKISVISTGIDCGNYYKNLANKSNVKEISFAENNQSLENQNETQPSRIREPVQKAFVDLQQTPKENIENEKKEIKEEKRSFFKKSSVKKMR